MTDEFLLPCRPGAALVALKAKAVVLPCYIHGAPYRRYPWSPLFMPARVEVTIRPADRSVRLARSRRRGRRRARRRCSAFCGRWPTLAGRPDFRAATCRPQLEADAGGAGRGDGRGGRAGRAGRELSYAGSMGRTTPALRNRSRAEIRAGSSCSRWRGGRAVGFELRAIMIDSGGEGLGIVGRKIIGFEIDDISGDRAARPDGERPDGRCCRRAARRRCERQTCARG